jgi:hypothetical protein
MGFPPFRVFPFHRALIPLGFHCFPAVHKILTPFNSEDNEGNKEIYPTSKPSSLRKSVQSSPEYYFRKFLPILSWAFPSLEINYFSWEITGKLLTLSHFFPFLSNKSRG